MTKRFFTFLMLITLIFSIGTTCFAKEGLFDGITDINGVDVGYGLGQAGLEGSIINKLPENDEGTASQEVLQIAGNNIFEEYRTAIIGITGLATLTFLIFFLINFIKLGKTSGNPQMREHSMTALIWTGIACAGCGAVTLFFGYFYGLGYNLSL